MSLLKTVQVPCGRTVHPLTGMSHSCQEPKGLWVCTVCWLHYGLACGYIRRCRRGGVVCRKTTAYVKCRVSALFQSIRDSAFSDGYLPSIWSLFFSDADLATSASYKGWSGGSAGSSQSGSYCSLNMEILLRRPVGSALDVKQNSLHVQTLAGLEQILEINNKSYLI